MATTEWKPYSLPRDHTESNRLNLQHKVYIANAGFLLHPRIAAALPEQARVADVGTGTGAWLNDLAAESPSSWSYTGFDISDAQFPQTNTGPCRFTTLNILDDVPDEYREHFDVVHLRLLVCGLSGADWATTARNASQLLKPGGWIQWHECAFLHLQVLQNAPAAPPSACRQLVALLLAGQAREGKMVEDVLRLAQTVRQAGGFQDCEDYVFSSDRVAETRGATNEIHHPAVGALARYAVQASPGLDGWTREKVEELMQRGSRELEGGKAYYRWDMHIVTARKPVV
ncbi:hypothetical protein LTR36_008955 [Oleoguttula mirabilis]|uniref:S-adenosyl-L-methionine-dependent methyltransferase n=1 Tax=Oleoguttula mirabilis TaxID=1507867 RepID=A0AAV9J7K4_9PEZI|nr:hypothetical protein LTR36_008955 [Oleoguttula mirabilis]